MVSIPALAACGTAAPDPVGGAATVATEVATPSAPELICIGIGRRPQRFESGPPVCSAPQSPVEVSGRVSSISRSEGKPDSEARIGPDIMGWQDPAAFPGTHFGVSLAGSVGAVGLDEDLRVHAIGLTLPLAPGEAIVARATVDASAGVASTEVLDAGGEVLLALARGRSPTGWTCAVRGSGGAAGVVSCAHGAASVALASGTWATLRDGGLEWLVGGPLPARTGSWGHAEAIDVQIAPVRADVVDFPW